MLTHMPVAYIALGSNLGNRADHLRAAARAIDALPEASITTKSPIYETPPAPGSAEGQGDYLNAVVQIETTLSPHDLLTALRDIEHQHGRERKEKWCARTLDLDILLYDDQVIDTPDLTIPHPHMHERWFVLKPLCDIAPGTVHPHTKKSLDELLCDLPVAGKRTKITW